MHDDDREEREEHEFYEILKRWATLDGTGSLCPYCRTEMPSDNQDVLHRLQHRIDNFNDIHAIIKLGLAHMEGESGLPKSRTEAERLFKIASDRGSPEAANYLAVFMPIQGSMATTMMRSRWSSIAKKRYDAGTCRRRTVGVDKCCAMETLRPLYGI